MKCVLHIGTEKTGTTTLQNWLYKNKEKLSKNGIFLSTELEFPNNRLLPVYFKDGLDDWAMHKGIKDLHEKKEYFETFEERVRAEFSAASKTHDLCIISSEHLHSRVTSRSEIFNLREFLYSIFDSVKINCYFRDQVEMALSYYSTVLKGDYNQPINVFVEEVTPANYYYNFLEIANNWAAVFGKSNCVFSVYDKMHLSHGDIRKDFLTKITPNQDFSDFDYTLPRANESLSALQASAFLAINRQIPYWSDDGEVSALNMELKRVVSSNKLLISGPVCIENYQEIRERFREINNIFLNEYFNGEKIFDENIAMRLENRSRATGDIEMIIQSILNDTISTLLPRSHAMLDDSDAEKLKNISVKLEGNGDFSISEAIYLMKLALKARPTGQFIKEKVAQFEKDNN